MAFLTRTLLALAALAALLSVSGCGGSKAACSSGRLPESGQRGEQFSSAPPMVINGSCPYTATLQTSKGKITIALEPRIAPMAVNNFVFLATHKFYTKILFHRVIQGFMIQTGDPQGTGVGGPGYSFKVENSGSTYKPGTVAMANTGQPNSNGSQFFICDQGNGCSGLDASWSQGQGYTIFGQVISGMSVVHALATVPVQVAPGGNEDSSPVTPIYLESVQIYEK